MGGGGNGSFIAKETAGNKFSDCRAKIPGREISGRVGCCVGRKPNGDLCVFAMVSYTYRAFQQNCFFFVHNALPHLSGHCDRLRSILTRDKSKYFAGTLCKCMLTK